jgi:ABC-type uncharacterized transport system involved in gliding motility auxiliary subunit
MNADRRHRWSNRIGSLLFYALLAAATGLLGWLSTRYEVQWDWTHGSRNSLSEVSRQTVLALDRPLHITAFASESKVLRQQIKELVGRYQRVREDIQLEFVNPELQPARIRELGITKDGELLLSYGNRSEKLDDPSESTITNSIQRLAQSREHFIVALEGHGERDLKGKANHDLGTFGQELERKGFVLQPLSLAKLPLIPDNTGVLVIAGPQSTLLPGEVEAISRYLDSGGNLLWLVDPGDNPGLGRIAEKIGVRFLPGVVVDANSRLLGIDNPAVVLVTDYPDHPVTRSLRVLSLYPEASAVELTKPDLWKADALLTTSDRTWNETGSIEGTIRPDPELNEQPGPLSIGLALSRELEGDGTGTAIEQRVVVIGDGDFLSNAFLGNGGNLDLGVGMVRWLLGEDRMLDIPARNAPDRNLQLPRIGGAAVALTLLVVLPLGLFATGAAIAWRRRRR